MSIDDINDPATLRRLAHVMCDAVDILHQIILKMEGPIPDKLLDKLTELADEADRLKNPN